MNVLDKIVRGSSNLDRMRREIDTSLSTIMGMFESLVDCGHCRILQTKHDDDKYIWLLVIGRDKNKGMSFGATCYLKEKMVYSYKPGEAPLRCENIQAVYESLAEFIEAMFNDHPKLKKKCEPLFRAADKF